MQHLFLPHLTAANITMAAGVQDIFSHAHQKEIITNTFVVQQK